MHCHGACLSQLVLTLTLPPALQFLHEVTIRGLRPGMRYAYRCGSVGEPASAPAAVADGPGGGAGVSDADSTEGGNDGARAVRRSSAEPSGQHWSHWRTFRARRADEQFNERDPLRLLVFGDLGVDNGKVTRRLPA